jgi:hypothetical protein
VQNALWPSQNRLLLQPLAPVVIRPSQAPAAHVLKDGRLGQRALELLLGQVEREVVNLLLGIFKRLQEEADFAQVSSPTGKKQRKHLKR